MRLHDGRGRTRPDCRFEAPDETTAAKVVMIIRSYGHGQTETWTAMPWERFELEGSVPLPFGTERLAWAGTRRPAVKRREGVELIALEFAKQAKGASWPQGAAVIGARTYGRGLMRRSFLWWYLLIQLGNSAPQFYGPFADQAQCVRQADDWKRHGVRGVQGCVSSEVLLEMRGWGGR
jgi:hypothetical protein